MIKNVLLLATISVLFVQGGMNALFFSFKADPQKQVIIYANDFDLPDSDLPHEFWCEGNTAYVKDGHLFVNADTALLQRSTIWLNKFISGNYRIEFDARILSSKDTANNLNCFIGYSHPSGKSLFETKNSRKDGNYPYYHKLNGYIFTYVANGNLDKARFRFRNNPGFDLLFEKNIYESRQGKTYHFKIEK